MLVAGLAIIAVIMALADMSQQAFVSTNCCPACLRSVARLQSSNKSITVLDMSEQVSESFPQKAVCGEVLNTHGSCCDQTTLEAYAVDFVKECKSEFIAIKKEASIILTYNQGYLRVSWDITLENLNNLQNNNKDLSSFGGSNKVDQMKELLTGLPGYLSQYNLNYDDFLAYEEKCLSSLFTFKVNGLCLACSGATSQFLNTQGGKTPISRPTCSKLVEDCSKVIYLVALSKSIIYSFRGFQGQKNFTDIAALSTLKDCASNPSNCMKDDAKLRVFCSYLRLLGLSNAYERVDGTKLSDNRRRTLGATQDIVTTSDVVLDSGSGVDIFASFGNGYTISGVLTSIDFAYGYFSLIHIFSLILLWALICH